MCYNDDMDWLKLLAGLRFFVRCDTLESKMSFCRLIQNRVDYGIAPDPVAALSAMLRERGQEEALTADCPQCFKARGLCEQCRDLIIAWELRNECNHDALTFNESSGNTDGNLIYPRLDPHNAKRHKGWGEFSPRARRVIEARKRERECL